MSVLDISYTIIFDNEKKISYKKLGVYYTKNNIVQDISAIFVIKPSKRYNNYLKNTDLSFTNNEYDLSFSNISSIVFTDISKNDGKLLPGKWTFGYTTGSITGSISDAIMGVKSIFIPYRDFLYDNNKPILIRDQKNLNKLFVNINHLELLKFNNNNKSHFFSLGKNDTIDLSGNTDLQILLDFMLWFPEDETTINLLKNNTWSLPNNYLGIDDKRIQETPVYHEENGNITLYENLSNFNEPGFRYDNISHIGNEFFINYVSKMEITGTDVNTVISYKNNIKSQYYLIQTDISRNLDTNPAIKFIKIPDDNTGVSIYNWELEIYVLEDSFLENTSDPSGVFSYSNTPDEKTGILFGIRGDGDDTTETRDLSGSKSYIFRDKDGNPYHANLQLYGVTKTGTKYNGGFTIRYKIRQNINNKYDVYIFINDQFVTKIDNSGCKLNDITYWGLPSDVNSMTKSVSRVFESKLTTYFNCIFQDNSIIGWENSGNLYPIKLASETNKMFSQTKGAVNYPISFKNNSADVWTQDAEYNYTFDAGENNTINFNFIDFSFNQIETKTSGNELLSPGNAIELLGSTMSISLSDDNINWVPMGVKWMHKTNNYIGNTIGGYLPAFYNTFYYNGSGIGGSQGNLINSQVWKNWIDDTNGFILPKNTVYAENMADISWNNINKVKTDYRYAKIKYKPVVENDTSSWEIRIYIKEDIGFNQSILSNYNNINIDSSDNQIESICYELESSTVNKTIFANSDNYSKNNYQIPYIARYDYRLQDFSNNIILKSQLDKDILYNVGDGNYNYNSKRTMNEIQLLPKTLSSLNDAFTIRQKYNYETKLLNEDNDIALPYIPGELEIKFINTNNTVIITIPNSQIVELKNSIINYWSGKNYATYVQYILYIWYPWTGKYQNYNTSQIQAGIDLSMNLTIDGSDEINSLDMESNTYYTVNQVGLPLSNIFNYVINEFSGRYLFSWSYKVFQPNGTLNNETPFDNLQKNGKTYIPKIKILNIDDFVKDDFIYDPQTPIITYIHDSLDSSFNKIRISLSDDEITNFNKNIIKHRRSLTSQNCDISYVEIKFYIWTPNNEKDTNPDGWELPSDYYGADEKRIISTPYRFPSLHYGITNLNWDPHYILNGITEFGYNIDSSGVIIKSFDISLNNGGFFIGDISGNKKMEYDISHGMIYFHPNDTKKEENKIPNPYNYTKNQIFGVPYLSRWQFKIYENLSFKDSLSDSTGDVLIKPTTSNDISYNGQYPIIFKDDGNGGGGKYSNNFEGVQVFDAGIGKTISLLIEDFEFDHDFTETDATYNDRLALLTSDLSGNDLSFNPIEVKWMQKTSQYIGDISGNSDSNSTEYYQNNNGFVFPKDKLTAVRNYRENTNETNDNDFENLSLHLIATNKRYVKFRFISNASVQKTGWKIKVFTSDKNPINIIESKVKFQEGNIGNTETDFNFKFKFDSDYYLELDKTIKSINTGITEFKDFVNTGISLGFQKKKEYLIIKINDVLWQFVIKTPPTGYIFDYLDEYGNILGQLAPISNVIIGPNNTNLKVSGAINSTIKFDDTNILFDETPSATTLDSGRKYILYIRKSTTSEKVFLNKFKKNSIIQFESETIKNRVSDWYPLENKYESSNNKYNYGVLFETEELTQSDNTVEKINIINECKSCRTITKTKNSKNFKLRYANRVKINFNASSRIKEEC